MTSRVVCLLLAFALASVLAQSMEEDKAGAFELKPLRIKNAASKKNVLSLRCTFYSSKTDISEMQRLSLVRTDDMQEMGAVITTRVVKHEDVVDARVYGKMSNRGKSTLYVTWNTPEEGFCRSYMFVATGIDAKQNQAKSYFKKIDVDAADGSLCVDSGISALSEKVDQCCQASEKVNENSALLQTLAGKVNGFSALPAKWQEQDEQLGMLMAQVSSITTKQSDDRQDIAELKKQFDSSKSAMKMMMQHMETLTSIFSKVLMVGSVKYDISGLNRDRFYIASKDQPNFDLEEMNNLCKKYDGYLAEIDDQKELAFVTSFLNAIGKYGFSIGANDVGHEGQFVYYNSKKPLPSGLWLKGQPSNTWGNENCVQILLGGLNDMKCNQPGRYVCEIPLE